MRSLQSNIGFHLIKGYLHAKKSKCLVQRFECSPVTQSARVQIQLDEVFLYVLLTKLLKKGLVPFILVSYNFIFVFESFYQFLCLNSVNCLIKVVQSKNTYVAN